MQLLFIIILSEFFKIREIRANKLSQKFLSRKVGFDVNSHCSDFTIHTYLISVSNSFIHKNPSQKQTLFLLIMAEK